MEQEPLVLNGSVPGTGFPSLVTRMNERPRVHWWAWLFWPRRSWWITQLIRESFEWRESSDGPPNALTWAESAFLRPIQAAQHRAVAKTARRINTLADRYQALRTKARGERRQATTESLRKIVVRSYVQIYAAGQISVARAKEIIEECRQRVEADTNAGLTRHQERPSRKRDILSSAPLAVDIVALTTIIAKFFNVTLDNAPTKIPETATAVGFALIGSLVLALLAHATGNAAWHLRAAGRPVPIVDKSTDDSPESKQKPGTTQEFPATRHILMVKSVGLLAVTTTTAVSIAIRIMHPTADISTGPVGVAIGLVVALATFIAPWLIVLSRMRSGSLEVRTIDELTSAIKLIEDAKEEHEKEADQAEDEAVKFRFSADRADTGERRSAAGSRNKAIGTIELARSHHRQNGRYAIDENVGVDEPYVAMAAALTPDRSEIEQAMARFTDFDEWEDDED